MEAGAFRGRIGRYHFESEPWWPEEPRPPAGAPNVLVVVLDDVGYAQLGCFGSDIETPNIDAVAAAGLRYANFHTTALCSPTRAAVLTGRNHHRVGMGRIVDLATGFPGYDARIPSSVPMLPAMLTPHGYSAYAVGKWHLTPEDEEHLGARRDRWPLGRGFERWYGFFSGETHQYVPALIHDSHSVPPPRSVDDGYHLSEDLADRTIEYLEDLRQVDVDKRWFVYLALGACHSPHHAPPAWLAKYRGRFDGGWDEWRAATLARQVELGLLPAGTRLSPRPDWVPAWDSLTADERTVYARYMEAFAGFLSHADHCLGRVFDWLRAAGEWDDTLVVVLSDNGASSEGGPTGSINDVRVWNALPRTVDEALAKLDEIGGPRAHNNYPWGWTVAGNTPFRRWKRETHEGGVADPLVVSWPNGIAARGEVRHQYVHAIDVAPTILAAAGLPADAELDGIAFDYSFDDAGAADRHTTQYYEMLGCRAIYRDGFKAVSYHEIQSEEPGLEAAGWELYDLRADPSEIDDLAASRPDLLAELVELWWAEAERNQVLPLDNRPFASFVFDRPSAVAPRQRYLYRPFRAPVAESVAVNARNRRHRVTASVTIAPDPSDTPAGVLLVQGSVLGGWSFHLLADGRLVYVHNLAGWRVYRVEADVAARLTPGDHELGFHFEPPGTLALFVDGDVVGTGELKRTAWARFSLTGAGLTCGWSPDFSPADTDYRGDFRFTHTLHHVVVDVDGDPFVDPEAEADHFIAKQ